MFVPHDPLASYIYIFTAWNELRLPAAKAYLRLDSSLTQYFFPNHYRSIIMINPQMFLFMKKRLYDPFSWMGFNWWTSRLEWEQLWGGSLLFTIKFQQIAGTHFLSTSEGHTTQILTSDPKKGVSVVTKMLFPQVDEGFWLYYTSFWYKNI